MHNMQDQDERTLIETTPSQSGLRGPKYQVHAIDRIFMKLMINTLHYLLPQAEREREVWHRKWAWVKKFFPGASRPMLRKPPFSNPGYAPV